MLSPASTQLASAYHQVKVGGDGAMLKGMMKAVLRLIRRIWRRAGPAF
jgi:anaerobic selenocysteine-containing dehydrogenase